MRIRARYFAFAAFVAVAPLQACGVTSNETEAASAFGKSASALADSVKTAISQAPQDEADIRAVRYVIDEDNGDFKKSGSLKITDLKGRSAAANVLASYGDALSKLLDSKTQDSDISSAVDKLDSAVKGVPSRYLKQASITPAEIDDAGKILTVLAEFYVDYRRREALEQIVPSVEPVVTKLCKMFARDFDYTQGGFAQTYYNAADRALDQSSAEANKTDVRKKEVSGLQNRANLAPVFRQADAVRTKALTTFGTIKDAAKKCSDASVALRKAVADPTVSFADIMDFANKAEIAYSAVHALTATK